MAIRKAENEPRAFQRDPRHDRLFYQHLLLIHKQKFPSVIEAVLYRNLLFSFVFSTESYNKLSILIILIFGLLCVFFYFQNISILEVKEVNSLELSQ